MAKVSTEKIRIEGSSKEDILIFSYDINVSKEGVFSTTLPKDIVKLFEEGNVKMDKNRSGNKGYLSNSKFDGLKKDVKDICEEYMSRELIGNKIVIKYVIQTTCAYVLDINNIPVPNASSEWTKLNERRINDWKEGTLNQNSSQPRPFGFHVYAKPYHRRDYKYKSGKIKVEYEQFTPFGGSEAKDYQYYLKWLEGIPNSVAPSESPLKEIDYTENVAKFFVDMIKSICMLNEKIKDFLEPESIKEIAEKGHKLIG